VPKTKPSYPPEFRREAVELLRFSGRPVKQIARELGVSEASLRGWRQRADIEAGKAEGLTSDERAELRELRKRVRIVEMERDVLKKATVFFARDSQER
jgi:transposase